MADACERLVERHQDIGAVAGEALNELTELRVTKSHMSERSVRKQDVDWRENFERPRRQLIFFAKALQAGRVDSDALREIRELQRAYFTLTEMENFLSTSSKPNRSKSPEL